VSKTLSVSAINNGTVIDHIPAGQALRIIKLLKFSNYKNCVTIGLNLTSKGLGFKDLIKIEDRFLSAEEANEITLFAPLATINIIKNFEVIKKVTTELPKTISNIITCPNEKCITHSEPVASCFNVEQFAKHVMLICNYCEKRFDRDVYTNL